MKRLWLQETVEMRDVHLGRVDGKKNLGDPFTKLQTFDEMMRLLEESGIVLAFRPVVFFCSGR